MNGHRVRIAQRGWHGAAPASHVDDVQVGVKLPWVELDGHRYDDLVSAAVRFADDEATLPELTLQVIGPVAIVYVDSDGEPLPGQQSEQLADDQCFDADTARPRSDAPLLPWHELDAWREVGRLIAAQGCDLEDEPAFSSCLDAWPSTPGRWCAPCRSLALLEP